MPLEIAPPASAPSRSDALLAERSRILAILMAERESHAVILADRDRLLAVFAHDLKNLMNVLVVNGEVRSRTAHPPAGHDDLSSQVLERMDNLISNLVDLARVNAGKLRVILTPSSAADVVREAVGIFTPLARNKSLTLELFVSDEDLEVSLDHDRIFQVLSNLLTNAIKFSSPGGTISISVTRIGDLVQIAVGDRGTGIEEEDLERVFEVYRQLDDAQVEGLGLGLFIARSIIEAHGGRIWVASRPGLGSTFYFTLSATQDVSLP